MISGVTSVEYTNKGSKVTAANPELFVGGWVSGPLAPKYLYYHIKNRIRI